jgi:hypothetical protein
MDRKESEAWLRLAQLCLVTQFLLVEVTALTLDHYLLTQAAGLLSNPATQQIQRRGL